VSKPGRFSGIFSGNMRIDKTIASWSSYYTFFDRALVASLKASTPFIKCREMRGMRQIFHYEPVKVYEGRIVTGLENVLTIAPYGLLISLAALVVVVGYWVMHLIR
jgi:hypothetical protein